MTSPDLTATNVDKIAAIFPGVITEALDTEGNPVEGSRIRQASRGSGPTMSWREPGEVSARLAWGACRGVRRQRA